MANYLISRVVTPASSLALVTPDQAKEALNIVPADTTQDAAVTEQIDQVSQAINNHCNRIFVRQGYRDQYRQVRNWLGYGQPLRTRQAPIGVDATSDPVLIITEDGTVLDPTLFEADLDEGAIYRLDDGAMPSMWAGSIIIVDYDGGFDPIPDD